MTELSTTARMASSGLFVAGMRVAAAGVALWVLGLGLRSRMVSGPAVLPDDENGAL